MDLGLSSDPHESFKLFQQRIVNEYEQMIDEFGLTVMDATLPIPEQQRRMRQLVLPYLRSAQSLSTPAQDMAWVELVREAQQKEQQRS
jgi:dTMP kinase